MAAAVTLAQLFPSGRRVARRLARLGIHTPADLLRADRTRVSAATNGALSVETLTAAASLASLLEVEGMTLAWAKALLAAGINSARTLSQQSFDKVAALRRSAAGRGGAAVEPAVAASWLRDAAVLANTGALNGTVVDARGRAVRGARVRCFGNDVLSDARGRFRILRLPLWYGVGVLVEKDGFAPVTEKTSGLAPPDVVAGRRFALRRRRVRARELSELKGDTLPAGIGTSTRIHTEQVDRIPAREIVTLVEFTKRGRARLASCFRSYTDGELRRIVYSVDRSALPADAAPGQYFRVEGGALRPLRMPTRALSVIRALRRLERQDRGGGTRPRTLGRKMTLLRRRRAALHMAGALRGSR
jgi:hypothetical protein